MIKINNLSKRYNKTATEKGQIKFTRPISTNQYLSSKYFVTVF